MKKTKIDWADSTWNPVTGCLHGCEYCYARRIAKRFEGYDESVSELVHISNAWRAKGYNLLNGQLNQKTKKGKTISAAFPFGFEPTLHRYKLSEPYCENEPQTIFVCSMADLFGEWIPDEWIEEVFEACKVAPQHRYLFLTKNPKRYEQFDRHMPDNMWFGWSQTKPNEVDAFQTHHSWNTFASIEPLHEEFKQFYPNNAGWIIIGAETGNRKGRIIPERGWIEKIVGECQEENVPVFMKSSLADIWGEPLIQQYPW